MARQKAIDNIKGRGKKEYEKAKQILVKRQVDAEAPALRAASRLNASLKQKLKGSKYEKTAASDSDEEMEGGRSVSRLQESLTDQDISNYIRAIIERGL